MKQRPFDDSAALDEADGMWASGPRLKLLQFVVEASFDAFVEGRN